jgi:hypothetical protein
MRYSTANLRELTRIAFFLRRRALLRLIAYAGIALRLEKCWGKTGVPVFLFVCFLCLISGCREVTAGWTLKADTLS